MTARADSTRATRDRIVGSMLELCQERWYDEITLRDIADGAEVSLQTVLNHFSSKDGVLAAMLEDPRTEQWFGARINQAADDAAAAVEQVVKDYERAGDAAIRMLALEHRVSGLGPVMAFGRAGHRQWVETTFADQLDGLARVERDRKLLALVCATDVYTWQILRRDQRLSRKETVAVMTDMAGAILRSARQAT